jgi:hypothetical protein
MFCWCSEDHKAANHVRVFTSKLIDLEKLEINKLKAHETTSNQ